MSIFRRIARVLETNQQVELDGCSSFGAWGESSLRPHLQNDPSVWFWQNGVLAPKRLNCFTQNPADYREVDYLIYSKGNMFCVEVKNLKGQILPGRDETHFIQVKRDSYGNARQHELYNPLKQVKGAIYPLKKALGQLDTRFERLPLIGVAAFLGEADISAIYNFETGIISLSQLPAFFESKAHPAYANAPRPWIMDSVKRLYSWDRLYTTENEEFYGILQGGYLRFKDKNWGWQQIPFQHLQSINLARSSFLSDHDELRITLSNGQVQSLACTSGELELLRPGGERQAHKLRNLSYIELGTSNKLVGTN